MIWLALTGFTLMGLALTGREASWTTLIAVLLCVALYQLAEYIERHWPKNTFLPADRQEAASWLGVGFLVAALAVLASPGGM